jgi:cephalosporin hydroxylase
MDGCVRPKPVSGDPDQPFRDFWKARLSQHTADSYRGRGLAKMPEDLRVYQHLIEEVQPEIIVELGTYDGGSALWFADQLAVLCGRGRVITVDTTNRRPLDDPRVTSIVGDHREPRTVDQIALMCRGHRVLVSEDSGHTYDSTLTALQSYSPLVSPGSWFVVEDGVVDEDVSIWGTAMGVQPAITDFLESEEGSCFTRHDLAVYGLTTNMGGWLQRSLA